MEFLKANIDHFIIAILGFMAFIVVWFSIERLLFYARINLSLFKNEDELNIALSKNLTTLYIIYQNAPYIGLLGTVAGIMITFYDMGMAGGIDTKSIILGLSLALKATALGLLVAIPTLMLYNVFLRRCDIILSKFKASLNENS